MNLPIPAGAHDLREPARVVAVGLVRHRPHRRLGLNGDGKADVFMWRGDAWTVNLSTGSNWAPATWSGSPGTGCVLVGDFNGDHRADVAIYHPAADNFSVNLSTGSGWRTETWPHSPQRPAYNEVSYKATHSSYWVKRDNVVEAGASGTQERLLDQALFESVRAMEIDIHRDDKTAHNFTVYHTDKQSNSLCTPLSECLKQLLAFQHALPDHDPLTIVLESKEVSPEDMFDSSSHTPADLDATLENYLGPYLFRPRDLLARCNGAGTVRDCLRDRGWPSTDQLRGKFIVAIIGNYDDLGPAGDACVPQVAHNWKAWVVYGTGPGGAAARSAFLMEAPWATPKIACQERIAQSLVDQAAAAAAFVQYEGNAKGLAFAQMQTWLADSLVVRADMGQDNKPSLTDQQAAVGAGTSLIQNDYPWHAYADASPLRPGTPINPEELAGGGTINEPGHRLLFRQKATGGSITLPARLGGTPSTRWETSVSNTRPTTDSAEPNPHSPRGVGCVYARSSDHRNGIQVCRTTADGHWNVQKPLGEDVIVDVEVTQNGKAATSTFYSDANDTAGKGGELLRLDVSQSAERPCAQAYSSELVVNDIPQWQQLQNTCFNAPLVDQGLAARSGDVLFVGTRMDQVNGSAAPSSAKTYFDSGDANGATYGVRNLTWPR